MADGLLRCHCNEPVEHRTYDVHLMGKCYSHCSNVCRKSRLVLERHRVEREIRYHAMELDELNKLGKQLKRYDYLFTETPK